VWLLLVVLAFGVVAGALMTWHHETQLYGSGTAELAGCEASASVNCDIVNTSRWSELAGVPIATLAVAAYLAIAALALWALEDRPGALGLVLAAGVAAALYSAFLFHVSRTELGYVCSWCIRLYAVNVAIPILALVAGRPRAPDRRTLVRAAAALAGFALLAVGLQRLYRHRLGGDAVAAPDVATELAPDPTGAPAPRAFDVEIAPGRTAPLVITPDDVWKGSLDAPVVVVELADFQCGACRRAAAALAEAVAARKDRLLFVFRHFPLNSDCNPQLAERLHPHACVAAQAAECAREQGRFWAMHDLLFANQDRLAPVWLRRYAERAGLDLAAYDACIASDRSAAAVRADIDAGNRLEASGTPRLIIDGVQYRGAIEPISLGEALDAAIARPR
jgi:protein-disulfide isomerase/uncharacterized membrane protein